jgi:predicted ATPase
MLTRLKVSGFKNLVDVDVRFGPFTCIAGANGVGKSNLFDAIRFLSALADKSFTEAAKLVRDEDGRAGDFRNLFHRVGDSMDRQMSFEAEMIIPQKGIDDFGRPISATATHVRYSLKLVYREPRDYANEVELIEESLVPLAKSDSVSALGFPTTLKWQETVLKHERDGNAAFISTDPNGDKSKTVNLHPDGGGALAPARFSTDTIPRPVIQAALSSEFPTTLLTRQELRSWRLLQLEPSALRKPDAFNAPSRLGTDGSYLAATLYHLAKSSPDPEHLYAQIAGRLSELIDAVRGVWVDADETRQQYTLYLSHRDGTSHPARDLSDGTLRFLALAVLEHDTLAEGVICFEEPENGIHPKRIPAMLNLLQDIALDPHYASDETNPLRQVIVNTHSPLVVQEVNDDDLVVAKLRPKLRDGQQFNVASFGYLPDEIDPKTRMVIRENWRLKGDEKPTVIAKGELLSYLNIAPPLPEDEHRQNGFKRVIDRLDVQDLYQLILPSGDDE